MMPPITNEEIATIIVDSWNGRHGIDENELRNLRNLIAAAISAAVLDDRNNREPTGNVSS